MKIILQGAFFVFMVTLAPTASAQIVRSEEPIQPVSIEYPVKLVGIIKPIEDPIQMVELMPIRPMKQEVNYQGEVNVSYGISMVDNFPGIINFETIHGIKVGHKIAVGIGVGVNVFQDEHNQYDLNYKKQQKNLVMIPAFVDIKWYVLDQSISPYVALDLGASISVGDHKYKYQGIYFAGGAGVSFRMKYKGAINLGLAVKTHQVYPMYMIKSKVTSITSLDVKAAIVF